MVPPRFVRGGERRVYEAAENGEADSRRTGGRFRWRWPMEKKAEWRVEDRRGRLGWKPGRVPCGRTRQVVRRAGICFRMEVRFGQMLLVLGANKTTVEFLIPLCQCTLRLTAA